MPFGQLVLGAPGAGKSTFCDGMQQFLTAVGRKTSVVNLDPANDHPSYEAALDVRNLVSLEEVMEAEDLGPNGGVLYAIEELEHNFEWLEEGLKELKDDYVLFDCPGQVELFTHHDSFRHMFLRLQKLGYRLVVLHLTDCHTLTRPSLYISALLQALRAMLQMDLPHLNVLTKIDTLVNYPPLPFNLDFYTEVQDLEYLLPHLDAEMAPGRSQDADKSSGSPDGTPKTEDQPEAPPSRFTALNRALVDLVDSFGLLAFHPLAIEDRKSMAVLLKQIDRATGYAFAPSGEGANETVWSVAMREQDVVMDVRDVQERWVDRREEWDEWERKQWEEEGKAAAAEGGSGGGVPGIGTQDGGTEASAPAPAEPQDSDDEDVGAGRGRGRGRGMMGRDSGIKITRKG